MIELLNLKQLNSSMQTEIELALLRVVNSGRYILGPEVEAFEREWASYCGAQHCVGTGNALDALRLILMALDIGAGDEVIVPSNTYIATWLAVSLAGAKPVPVEPSRSSRNIDPDMIQSAITSRTRAIIAVHLYGMPCDMERINQIAQRNGLAVLEDAAQAHGARAWYDGAKEMRRIGGATSDAAAFSFYPSKNLGALGDAGAITTNDAALADRARRLRNYGGVGRLDHRVRGINSRLDEMQAAVLRAKLPFLDQLNADRAYRAGCYLSVLKDSGLGLPEAWSGAVWHQFTILSKCRDALIERLARRGVDAHIHYPIPPHLEGAYADMKMGSGSFPIAEWLAERILSLPIGNDFDVAKVARIVAEEASRD